jgi:hypothetical protein
MLEDLVFDIRMHNGDDTEEHLARRSRVAAFEAKCNSGGSGKEEVFKSHSNGLTCRGNMDPLVLGSIFTPS